MLISRLLRSLLRFLTPGIVPDATGGAPAPDGGAPAADTPPVVDASAAPDAGAAPAAPAGNEPPAEPMGGLRGLLDKIGTDPNTPVDTRPRDAMGRFLPTDPNAQPQTPPQQPVQPPQQGQQPSQQPPQQTPPAPKPGEIDLTPPEGMTERAHARWQQLTERVKQVPELERRATEATSQLDAVRQMVAQSGLAPNEFSDMLETGRLLKSANPQDAQKALQRLDAIRSDLAQRWGLDAAGVDPLAAHPDLKADVDGMLMTRERALEIARLRQQNQQAQNVTQEQRELQQHQQAVQGAAVAMDTALRSWAATPGHEGKVAHIRAYFANPQNMQAWVATYQPQQWTAALKLMYDSFTAPAAAAPQVHAAPVVPPGPQPLRPGNTRAGAPQRNGPVTAQGAIENAFAAAGL